jgi:SAM-dependent methyltransferase
LDLGCGDGVLTAKLASMGCHVIGVDASAPQIDAARKLGLDVLVMRGEALDFDSEFDAVFSNAALHWMSNPAKVIAGVRRALKPHGRFVAEFGGHGCVAKIRKALVEALNRRGIKGEAANPWYFPTVEDYSQRLIRSGFVVNYVALIRRPRLRSQVMSSVGWKPFPRVSLQPCRPQNDPPISLKSERA